MTLPELPKRLRATAHAMSGQLTVEEIARFSPSAIMLEAAEEIDRLQAIIDGVASLIRYGKLSQ
jgi:hypothetical protein